MNRKVSRRRRQGFTLLEVLLVLAILVILGSMVGVYFVGMQDRGYADAAKTQMGLFEQQMKFFRMDVGRYPSNLEDLRKAPADLANPEKWKGPYAEKDLPPDPWGRPYQLEADGQFYTIKSLGPDINDASDDITVSNKS